MDKGKKAVVEFLRKYLTLPARYEEEIKKASGYLQNAIDRGYSTKDKWEAEIEKSKTELRKIEANIPLYRDILTTILQEPERLKFLAKTRIEQSRWNVREKYMDVFPYIQCVDVSRIDTTHYEIHASEVVCILLQLLGIVFHAVLICTSAFVCRSFDLCRYCD